MAVVGLGKIGLPIAAVYASRGFKVVGCDVDSKVVADVNSGRSPIEEPGLRRLIEQGRGDGSLGATVDTTEAVRHSNVVVIIVPLLIDESFRPDFSNLISATQSVAAGLQRDTLVLVETTMPVGSTRCRVLPLLEASGLRVGDDLRLAYSPERVSSGTILQDLVRYPKIVGGVDENSTASATAFYTHAIGCDVLVVNGAETAEFTKLIETSYRDVNIALANEYARYATNRGLDVMEAITAANTQPFSHIHTPGIGVGGHCIPIYPYFLMQDKDELILPVAARAVNDSMPEWCVELLERELNGLAGRRVLVLGLAYRPNVAERACSPTVPLIAALRARGARVLLHDPLFADQDIVACGGEPVELVTRPHVDAAVIQCWHKAYDQLDFSSLPGCRVVLDGRNRLSPGVRDDVRYVGVGRAL